MEIYVFLKKGLTVSDVQSIISDAGESPIDFAIDELLDNTGVQASSLVNISISRLENAAKRLKIKKIGISSYSESIPRTYIAQSAKTSQTIQTKYEVEINLPAATVSDLTNGNYSLFAFKAVKASAGGGKPVLWFKSDTYSGQTNVHWHVDYAAYTSQSKIIPNGKINASLSYPITLGDTLDVTGTHGVGHVTQVGQPDVISIENKTASPFTCGISQKINGQSSPMCAFPLYGNGEDQFAPIEKVMFMFATAQVNTGTVIENALTNGIIVDLTGAPKNTRTVNFDMNNGWDWGGHTWASPVANNAPLVPILFGQ